MIEIDREVDACRRFARALHVTIHIRGTDDRPVLEFKDKRSRRVVGLSELKARATTAGIPPDVLHYFRQENSA